MRASTKPNAHRNKAKRQTIELETLRRVQEIDRQLFLLVQADYDAAVISPSLFLAKQKAFLEGELAVMRKEMEVEGEIRAWAHFD